jgi:GNAT superfamily N-acetyltransferase
VYQIDMTERGDMVYEFANGELRTRQEEWERPPRTQESWDRKTAHWEEILGRDGAAIGAFAQGRMVGIAVYRPRLRADMGQLDALYVSRERRRSGVARALVRKVIELAGANGEKRLYVSATPSCSAVGFYLSLGFAPTSDPDPALFELEPEDIHMILGLSAEK